MEKCKFLSNVRSFLLLTHFFSLFLYNIANAQKQGDVWCFGQSALIDFSDPDNPIVGESSVDSRGSCSSVSTPDGQLLFYVSDIAQLDPDLPQEYLFAFSRWGVVYNRFNQPMPNGYGLLGEAWYHEHVILPMPNNSSKYYIFSLMATDPGVDTIIKGIYYSIVDMQADSGRGDVVLKNQSFYEYQGEVNNGTMFDGELAVQHGNGRDWWLYNAQTNGTYLPAHDTAILVRHLITPEGIFLDTTERISLTPDTTLVAGFGEMLLNPKGDKLMFLSKNGKLSEYTINRCTGEFELERVLYVSLYDTETNESLNETFLGALGEYSPNGNLFYLNVQSPLATQQSYLYQLNLLDIDPFNSKYLIYDGYGTVDFDNNDFYADIPGELKSAPDNKIYSATWLWSAYFNWPYSDTSDFSQVSMNLSVVNDPDSLGAACNFQPYSFPLGGNNRSYWGLPNNPNYRIGPLDGSPCDTLGINALQEIKPNKRPKAFTYPNPAHETVWLSIGDKAYKNSANPPVVTLYNVSGKKVFETKVQQLPVQLNIGKLPAGIYSGRLTFIGAEYYFKVVKE